MVKRMKENISNMHNVCIGGVNSVWPAGAYVYVKVVFFFACVTDVEHLITHSMVGVEWGCFDVTPKIWGVVLGAGLDIGAKF